MKRIRATYQQLLFAVLAGWTAVPVLAQTPYDAVYREEAIKIEEKLQLFSDRSIYSVNETIHFVADYSVSGPISSNTWSSVLYVELIAGNGTPLAQGKYRISEGKSEGTLHIPSESLTGNYYLKAYTRWMRNRGPQSFSYTALKIINPHRTEVAEHSEDGSGSLRAKRMTPKEGILVCTTASSIYRGGEEVLIQLKGASTVLLDQLSCCLTVVPEGAIDLEAGTFLTTGTLEPDSFQVKYLPDLSSDISISGTVVGADLNPVAYATLHFALLGNEPDFFATMSDINGRFILTVPSAAGDRLEFFVTPEQEESGLEVRIDQEFDSRTVAFPAEPFRLPELEREVARKIALNTQISKAFVPALAASELASQKTISEGQRIPFYGTRVKRLLIDDYVRLPNLEEVFLNLVPEIQFYKKRGETRIRFISDNESIGVYNPLIMIDHISVFDHEALLALSPDKIERVDLINEIYLKGNVAFGGVLAIHSRKGDMAGIDLPLGSYFFDYQSFNLEKPVLKPYEVTGERVPDTRNTFFWAGDVRLDRDQPTELVFQAPDLPGKYVIHVRGVLAGGEVFSASSLFQVE